MKSSKASNSLVRSFGDLSERDYRTICQTLYRITGISVQPGKEGLIQSRIARRLRALDLDNYGEYVGYLLGPEGGREISDFVDALTTNKTDFFREQSHFDYLENTLRPRWEKNGKTVRIWSAGCSTGEEPYTTMMVLRDLGMVEPHWSIKMLATDISSSALAAAKKGEYAPGQTKEINRMRLGKYLESCTLADGQPGHRIRDELRKPVSFARLNLLEDWPMRGPFELIFCRNVMIYFESDIRKYVTSRLASMLAPGGTLFIGVTEAMGGDGLGLNHLGPGIYERIK